ncbi:MAG: hypothetical protein AAFX81_19615, partial [Pseudomonadota bacterium]
MDGMALTAEDLLAGASVEHEIELPSASLAQGAPAGGRVRVRPLSVRDLQMIARAAKDDDGLSAAHPPAGRRSLCQARRRQFDLVLDR